VEILNLIDHPNCIKRAPFSVRFNHCTFFIAQISFVHSRQYSTRYFGLILKNMIFEYAPSMTLKEFIRNGPLPLSTVKNLFYQVRYVVLRLFLSFPSFSDSSNFFVCSKLCRALEYLHDLNIVHRGKVLRIISVRHFLKTAKIRS